MHVTSQLVLRHPRMSLTTQVAPPMHATPTKHAKNRFFVEQTKATDVVEDAQRQRRTDTDGYR